MRQKFTFKDIVGITVACIVAFGIGILIALPVILKIELASSAIDYMNRH